MKRNTLGLWKLVRRMFAFALAALMGLQLLPGTARADETDSMWKTLDDTLQMASSGKAMSNTYILEVSSGSRRGGGAADNVKYFIISYTTADGQHRTVVLAPGEEAVSQGFGIAAAQGNREERRKTVEKVFGYTTEALAERQALGSMETDQYLFTTPASVQSIDKIQIFGMRNEQHGDWACQGMRVYRVDTLYGLEMYGWYSEKGYIDFDGALIARVETAAGGVIFKWSSTSGMYSLTSSTPGAKLVNTSEQHTSQLASRLVFRIDFADVAGAGFESLAGSYAAAGGKTRISDLKFCETAALIVRYTDVYGCVREITLPLVINALGQIMEVMGDAYIAEFAQQGDTIAVPAMLPDFANLESVNIAVGETAAAKAANLITGTVVPRNKRNTPMAGGVFILEPEGYPRQALAVANSLWTNTNVQISSYTGSGLQRWKLEDAGDGYYVIAAAEAESLVLDAAGGKATNGTNVSLYTRKSSGADNQKWKLEDLGDGYYAIRSYLDEKQCLDVQMSSGKNVQMYGFNGTGNQKWRFTNVSTAGMTEKTVVENADVKADPVRSARVAKSETDAISYICFAAYKDVTVQAGLEGATLRIRFTGGTPLKLSTATSTDGVPLQASQTSAFLLRSYESGIALAPRNRMERYLVTLSTDNVPNAGTAGDIYLQFRYISVQDKELESTEYRIRDYIREFYGEWPGNVEEFAYNYGLRDGGTVRFMIPLQGVKEFESVSVRVSGEDEWQFTGIEVAMVKASDPDTGERSWSPRLADWEEIAVTGLNNQPDGLFSHLVYDRDVETEEACLTIGTVYEEGEERPDPTDPESDWTPGSLIQDDGESYIFDGETQEVVKKEDVPWDELRHYMTFDDTQRDLGFTKERCTYTVSVQVAGKTVNTGNDDCGSKNLFYFRLIFENGNSGCTLANQQIVGDAFRTGDLVQFKIPTSQDYGEVVAVQVIPDSQDSNSDIYDKLQIESISVTRDTVSAVSPTWTAKVASSEDEGWVGIDYRDPGETATRGGAEGRTLSELATTFPITETSYSTNLLVSITTASYETGKQFTGGVGMELNFINAEGRMDPQPISGFDVVEAMNSYGGLTGSKQRRYKDGGETVVEDAAYYVSDSRYQFLPGSTDSFIVTIQNVYQLTDMTLTVYSDVVTQWTIKDVNVFQLNGQGIRYLNPSGSYAYRYLTGQEPTLVATWEQDRVTTPLAIYDAAQNSSMQPISFALKSETIKLSEDAAKWSSTISPVPKSHDDTMNLILYPVSGNGAADPGDYDVVAAVQYTDSMTKRTLQVSTGEMKRGTDAAGNAVFYAYGLSASNLEAINGVDWSADILRTTQPTIPSGVLQVVRGGVLIDSYPLVGAGYSMRIAAGTTAVSTQRLLLQVSEDTKKQTLKSGENDLAVALYFRGDTPGAQEYRSRYVFLTELGITEVRPGQLLEIDYHLGNVGEFTGVNVVSMGKLDMSVSSALLADQATDGTVGNIRSIRSGFQPGVSPVRCGFDGQTQLLTLTMETAEDENTAYSGTEGPLRMVLGYYDIYGEPRSLEFRDIRPYIASGEKFAAGSTDTVQMLVSDMSELRWIELEPLSALADGSAPGEEESLASWKVSSVSATVGLDGREMTRTLDQRVLEGKPLHIGFSDIVLLGTVYVAQPGGDLSEPLITVSSGKSDSVTVDSGADVFITVRLSGSDDGFAAKLAGIDPVTGEVERAILDATHGYSDETLDMLYERASSSVENATYEQEREAAQRVVELVQSVRNTAGRFYKDQIRLTTPHNYTDSKLKYRITVSSEENPEAFFTLDVIIRSEPNELPEAIAAWNGVRTVGTVEVRGGESGSGNAIAVLEGQTVSQMLESGGGVTIHPHGSTEEDPFDAVLQELDPVTGTTGKASLGAKHGYTESRLQALLEEAQASMDASAGTEAEKLAARAVVEAIHAIRGTEGSFEAADGEIRFTAPRNYTGEVLNYRITVTSARTGDAVFTVDVSIKQEENPLPAALAAWRSVQTVGTVSVVDRSGKPADTVLMLEGDTLSQLLESGGGLVIVPYAGEENGGFDAVIRELDPATNATGAAKLGATHGYTEEELAALLEEVHASLTTNAGTDAERQAAREVMNAINAVSGTEGAFQLTGEEARFTAPRNYTGGILYYRITVTSARTGNTLFTVDVSVKAEDNPLPAAIAAWRGVQTVGSVSVLDERGRASDKVWLAMGEAYAQLLGSGRSISITPNSGDSGFTATLRSLDPATGATGTADLEVSTGYTTEELYALRNEARAAMSDYNATEAEIQAARAVVTAVDSMRNLDGDFDVSGDEIEFTAPHNYTGGMLYYRITVTASQTGETLFTVDLSVEAEPNPLDDAVAAWKAVQTAGTVRILDAYGDTVQTVSLMPGETYAQQLESGGSLIVQPRTSGSFRTEISSLDPTIGATSVADLDSVHNYSESDLDWMEELARDALREETDDALLAAARTLLSAISEVQSGRGSYRTTDGQVRFTAPRNYTGSTIYFKLTVTSSGSGETLITMNISVSSERDPVSTAFNAFDKAVARVDAEKAAAKNDEDDGGTKDDESTAEDGGENSGAGEGGSDEGEG